MENVIDIINVSKTYDHHKKKVTALEDVTLNITKGQFVSVMGPSGCGKSTLSKIIAGIEKADAGKLNILGQDCSKGVPREVKTKIGYVFQWHNLLEWLTVEQNLFFPLEMFDIKKDFSWSERAEQHLDLVGLKKAKNAYPHELSGGMRQRVGIARSLMMDPELLVLDQPFGALDAITRKMIARSFHKLCYETGKTVFMITSDIEEAILYSDMVCLMTPLPGKIQLVMNVDFPYEKRTDELRTDDYFLELRLQLIKAINQQD
jgi:NitT/TauT family transport system ATP-binding protein